MQLVRDTNGEPLAKGQRAVLAYLHRESIDGFKGRPVLSHDKVREERGLTPFNT